MEMKTAQVPQPRHKATTEYDFLEVRDFIEGQIPGGGDILWQHAADNWNLSNDSYLSWFCDTDSYDPRYEKDEATRQVMQLFHETFVKPHKEADLMFWVCW